MEVKDGKLSEIAHELDLGEEFPFKYVASISWHRRYYAVVQYCDHPVFS